MISSVNVNGRYLAQRVTGQQRYAREIVARFVDKFAVIEPTGYAQGSRGHLWEQCHLPRKCRGGLLWSPSTTGPLAVRNQVVTIHDCSFVDHAECFSRNFARWYQFLVPRLARRACQIITISDFSKQRIVDVCRVPEEKVEVIYSGVDSRFRVHSNDETNTLKERMGLPDRFILCVGSIEPRKNLSRLLEAWSLVQPELKGIELVLAGASGHVFEKVGLRVPSSGVRLLGYVDDQSLPVLYSAAHAFIYPSIYEGFGLPVIEAMASGVPVITSSITSLPEIAGGAAQLIDPYDIESIADGIRNTATNSQLSQSLIDAGLRRAALFNWDDCAKSTWANFERAIAQINNG